MTIRQDFQRAMDSEIAALAAFPTPTLPEAIGQCGTMPMAIKRKLLSDATAVDLLGVRPLLGAAG